MTSEGNVMSTLAEVFTESSRDGRVCPKPQAWQKLYDLLPDKHRSGTGWEPSLPLILGAWSDAPNLSKMLRFREHLEWAAKHDCLDSICDFLRKLPEENWHHLDE